MDPTRAAEMKSLLEHELETLKRLSFEELRAWVEDKKVATREQTGESGASYQLELQAMWDDHPDGNIRVVAAIDAKSWRSFAPMTDDFIMKPSGELVGE